MPELTLTGRTRLRHHTHLFGPTLLVLQVEVNQKEGPSDSNGPPEWLAGRLWIDARVCDVTLSTGQVNVAAP